ncbi:MAG TPA: maleylpyruvate isomerase N-terminal domain-containing protein [Acidimicrobiales bacterium]|nr:maleylpyruvate isomerase N-terminal domain-containing protein [Acidimicrobiales bacterium]
MTTQSDAAATRSVTVLRQSHDRLAALVAGLDAAGVCAPSYAKDWSIAQVMSHLGSQAEIFEALLDAGITGEDPPGQEAFPPIWDAWNARSPEAQTTDSIAFNARFVRSLEGLDAAQRDSFRVFAFGMDLDMSTFLRLRVPEHAVHSWDVAVALDRSATVLQGAVEIVVDGLPRVAALVGKPREGSPMVRVTTTDPERAFALVTDGVRLEPWSERAVGGELQLSAEELLRLVYGRLDAAHTHTAGLKAEGISLDDVRTVFPGV